jgi:hypothetical protein
MEDKAAAAAPQTDETTAQLSEDELNTVAGGISPEPGGSTHGKLPPGVTQPIA